MPEVPPRFLFGLSEGLWHALGRHDPEYRIEHRTSERLTGLARANARQMARQQGASDEEIAAAEAAVKDVMVQLPSKIDGPGTGRTMCGIENLPLEEIGTDPESGDRLCPACKRKMEM